MHDDSILRLLAILYAAPTAPRCWDEFLRELGRLCGVQNGTMMAHNLTLGTHRVVAGLGDAIRDSGQLYESHYYRFDEWTSRLYDRGIPGNIGFGEEIWPESCFLESVFYNDFLKQFDIRRIASVFYAGGPGVFEGISLYRGKRDDRFGPEERAILRAISPHLRIAFATRRKLLALETRATDLENAVDATTAMLLIDAAGDAIYVSQPARNILAGVSGLSLNKRRLVGRCSSETATLRALIDHALAIPRTKRQGGAMSFGRANMRPLHILVAPIGASDARLAGNAAAAVFLHDSTSSPLLPASILQTLFGLTPAEARLTLCMLEGHSLSEAAELGCVSRETVKSQMKAVLAKTGTRRQGDMIRLLARLPGLPFAANFDARSTPLQ